MVTMLSVSVSNGLRRTQLPIRILNTIQKAGVLYPRETFSPQMGNIKKFAACHLLATVMVPSSPRISISVPNGFESRWSNCRMCCDVS